MSGRLGTTVGCIDIASTLSPRGIETEKADGDTGGVLSPRLSEAKGALKLLLAKLEGILNRLGRVSSAEGGEIGADLSCLDGDILLRLWDCLIAPG